MDEADLICLRLAKDGYGGGNPESIQDWKTETILSVLEYTTFLNDYEATLYEINKSDDNP
jgi:hypothetical protein